MKDNPVQFAVVREDPRVEMDIILLCGLSRAVLIGSGGCTAFSLKALNPDLEITLIEPNAAQVELVREKIRRLKNCPREELFERFGVGETSENSLIECGNFESLFRQFRLFIREFIAPEPEIERAFSEDSAAEVAAEFWTGVFAHKYWRVAFELFFSDSLLTAMFTESAVRHAPKGSYPGYFRRALERGLTRSDAGQNYFLHHIFLGRYLNRPGALPFYLAHPPANLDFELFGGFAQDFQGFGGRQLIHFSNIFDWCDEPVVEKIAESATEKLEAGGAVVFRQLNNDKNYRPLFGGGYEWLPTAEILKRDRSLFYSKIEIGRKI